MKQLILNILAFFYKPFAKVMPFQTFRYIACVVGGRRLILADEPTGALDSVTGELVLRMLRNRVDAGAAAILVTHEARHAAWADRIVFLRDGRIVDETRRDGADALLATAR